MTIFPKKLLKENPHLLAETITQQFKLAKAIPIFKKNDKTNPDNYKQLSLLSTINKIMEQIMYER